MSDPEYNAVWPGTYGHFNFEDYPEGLVQRKKLDEPDEPSWADIVLEQAIEETMLARAERKRG